MKSVQAQLESCLRATMTPEAIIENLKTLLDVDKVRTDSESLTNWCRDWTKQFEPAPLAIVYTRNVQDVQAVVRLANAHKLALPLSGGRTELSAGVVAANGKIVVSFDYKNRILDFNAYNRTVTC